MNLVCSRHNVKWDICTTNGPLLCGSGCFRSYIHTTQQVFHKTNDQDGGGGKESKSTYFEPSTATYNKWGSNGLRGWVSIHLAHTKKKTKLNTIRKSIHQDYTRIIKSPRKYIPLYNFQSSENRALCSMLIDQYRNILSRRGSFILSESHKLTRLRSHL